MIFCNECGYKSPDHKPNCSQAGGPGATPQNTYAERQVLDAGPTVNTDEVTIASNLLDSVPPAEESTITITDTSSTDTSTSTGE